MDTRTKIISYIEAERLASGVRTLWAQGSFDPLLAEHAARFRELAQTGQVLIVSITDPDSPLMPRTARAELVAGIASVDYVVLDDATSHAVEVDPPRIRSAFIDHVILRHRTEVAG